MKNQLSVIDSRIQELFMIRSRLVNRCQQMEETRGLRGKESSVFLEDISSQYILVQSVEKPYTLREISIATKQCFSDSFQKQLPVFFQCGVVVPLERILEGCYTEASHAFLPIEKTDKAENIRKLPAGKCAGIYHVGAQIRGNADLQNGYNYNLDLRYELFKENGNMFSVTAYYKHLENPIEQIQELSGGATVHSFQNASNGMATGLEIEFRKELLRELRLGANASFMYTDVKLPEGGAYTNTQRALQGLFLHHCSSQNHHN